MLDITFSHSTGTYQNNVKLFINIINGDSTKKYGIAYYIKAGIVNQISDDNIIVDIHDTGTVTAFVYEVGNNIPLTNPKSVTITINKNENIDDIVHKLKDDVVEIKNNSGHKYTGINAMQFGRISNINGYNFNEYRDDAFNYNSLIYNNSEHELYYDNNCSMDGFNLIFEQIVERDDMGYRNDSLSEGRYTLYQQPTPPCKCSNYRLNNVFYTYSGMYRNLTIYNDGALFCQDKYAQHNDKILITYGKFGNTSADFFEGHNKYNTIYDLAYNKNNTITTNIFILGNIHNVQIKKLSVIGDVVDADTTNVGNLMVSPMRDYSLGEPIIDSTIVDNKINISVSKLSTRLQYKLHENTENYDDGNSIQKHIDFIRDIYSMNEYDNSYMTVSIDCTTAIASIEAYVSADVIKTEEFERLITKNLIPDLTNNWGAMNSSQTYAYFIYLGIYSYSKQKAFIGESNVAKQKLAIDGSINNDIINVIYDDFNDIIEINSTDTTTFVGEIIHNITRSSDIDYLHSLITIPETDTLTTVSRNQLSKYYDDINNFRNIDHRIVNTDDNSLLLCEYFGRTEINSCVGTPIGQVEESIIGWSNSQEQIIRNCFVSIDVDNEYYMDDVEEKFAIFKKYNIYFDLIDIDADVFVRDIYSSKDYTLTKIDNSTILSLLKIRNAIIRYTSDITPVVPINNNLNNKIAINITNYPTEVVDGITVEFAITNELVQALTDFFGYVPYSLIIVPKIKLKSDNLDAGMLNIVGYGNKVNTDIQDIISGDIFKNSVLNQQIYSDTTNSYLVNIDTQYINTNNFVVLNSIGESFREYYLTGLLRSFNTRVNGIDNQNLLPPKFGGLSDIENDYTLSFYPEIVSPRTIYPCKFNLTANVAYDKMRYLPLLYRHKNNIVKLPYLINSSSPISSDITCFRKNIYNAVDNSIEVNVNLDVGGTKMCLVGSTGGSGVNIPASTPKKIINTNGLYYEPTLLNKNIPNTRPVSFKVKKMLASYEPSPPYIIATTEKNGYYYNNTFYVILHSEQTADFINGEVLKCSEQNRLYKWTSTYRLVFSNATSSVVVCKTLQGSAPDSVFTLTILATGFGANYGRNYTFSYVLGEGGSFIVL